MKLGMQLGLVPGHIVLDGDPAPLSQRGTVPQFLEANGCIDQDATWYGGIGIGQATFIRWGPSSPSPKKGAEPPRNFRSMFIVAKRLDGLRWYLARR